MATGDAVWIVEHRSYCLGKPETAENVVMHVASSQEKAVAWCQLPAQLKEPKNEHEPWWYAISAETVDTEKLAENHYLLFVYWDGTTGVFQPVGGYAQMRKTMEYARSEENL
jgi:hypothetical protein